MYAQQGFVNANLRGTGEEGPNDIVMRVWLELLGRNPTSGELSSWAAWFASHGQDEGLLRAEIKKLPEYVARRSAYARPWIVKAFRIFLGREPSTGELDNWYSWIIGGNKSESELRAAVGDSPECQEFRNWLKDLLGPIADAKIQSLLGRARSGNDDQWIGNLLQSPRSVDEGYWEAARIIPLADVQGRMAAIVEAYIRNSKEYKIYSGYYAALVRRAFADINLPAPNQADVDYWVNWIVNVSAYGENYEHLKASIKNWWIARNAGGGGPGPSPGPGPGPGTTTAGFNLDFLRNKWVWIGAAVIGGLYYWIQTRNQPMGHIPYIGKYPGGKPKIRKKR